MADSSRFRVAPPLVLVLVVACGDDAAPPSDGGPRDGGLIRIDGGIRVDGGDPRVDGGDPRVDGGDPRIDGAIPPADGGVRPTSECSVDADCGDGRSCIELIPGIWVCSWMPPEATECSAEPGLDECCASSECTSGACYLGPIVPYCGGPAIVPYNVCASDACASDIDCPSGSLCLPAGAFGRPTRTCMPASCTSDFACGAAPGGLCILYRDACCNLPSLQCRYLDGCNSGSDCPSGHCEVRDGATRCAEGPPVCPA